MKEKRSAWKEIQFHAVQNPQRFEKGQYNEPLYREALEAAVRKVRENLERYIDKYPHVSENNVYPQEENKLRTASFFPGIVSEGSLQNSRITLYKLLYQGRSTFKRTAASWYVSQNQRCG